MGSKASLIIISLVLLCAALSYASTIFAPVAFALLLAALLWPVQRRLQSILPRYVALLITLVLFGLVFVLFGWTITWAFGRVARWVIADAARFQQIYEDLRLWLESHGLAVGVLWTDNFGTSWILRTVQLVTARVNNTFSFWAIAVLYLVLGLIEIGDTENRIRRMRNRTARVVLLRGSRSTTKKLRDYMLIRTLMSMLTGTLFWLFALFSGLPLAAEWGVLAFALNYIPFVGSFVATLLPTSLALVQFESWESVLLVFLGFNLIQFMVGSYIEPRVTGNALSMSPVIVLFSVFFWGSLWGVFGAFIGVPITIALLTFCKQHPSSRWVFELFGADNTKVRRAEIAGSAVP